MRGLKATRHSICATITCVRSGLLLPKVDAAADRAWGLVVAKVRVVAQDRAAAGCYW
jgi:hypothetical protein